MPYKYLDEVSIADVGFCAWGKSMEEMFISAADAAMNVMVENLSSIASSEQRVIFLEGESIERLLFQFLQEFIYFKDAESLLLRVSNIRIEEKGDSFHLNAVACGETIDAGRHNLKLDVKAVTFHKFKAEKTARGWKSVVVLDV